LKLDRDQKESWKAALRGERAPWIAFGLDSSAAPLSDRLSGMAGLIDWHLHGQVSRLLAGGSLQPEEFCLVPTGTGAQNFLLYHFGPSPDAKAFAAQAKKLKVTQLALASSTFPKDFLSKLEQNLKKEGIHFSHLEP
jgi:hypothetical protein